MNRFSHKNAVTWVAEIFSKRGFKISSEYSMGGIARADLLVYKGEEPWYAIEVKVGPLNHYLPYSAYAQAQRMHSMLPKTQPIICTTMAISKDLKTLFTKAGIPVVVISATLKEKEFFNNLRQEIMELRIEAPDEFKE